MTWSQASQDAINKAIAEGRAAVDGKPVAITGALENSNQPVSEKDFMAEVLKYAKSRGWRCYHTTDSRKSAAGFPDLVMVRNGRLVVAELKVGDNEPTADQQSWLDDLIQVAHNVHASVSPPYVAVFLWLPSDWPTIARVLS